jgi:hypothetical protein
VPDRPPRGGADPVLAAVATRYSVADLAAHVLGVRACGAGEQQPEADRLRAAVNANWLAEIAARDRPAADVAGLAAALGGQGEDDLAAHVLDVCAADRDPGDLARLAAGLDGDGLAPRLLRTVIRRRLPLVVADLLAELADGGQDRLAGEVLAGLAAGPGAADTVYVVLGLRARQRADLTGQVTRAMAAALGPADLAGFALGLRRHQDHGSAAQAVGAALGQDAGRVADLLGFLFAADPAYADGVLDQAVDRLAPADRLVLASLLEERLAPETASAVWARIVPGLEDNKFVEAMDALVQHAGAPGVHRALREAARAHSIERVGTLVLQVQAKRIDGGVETIFDTVVRYRPVAEIDQLTSQLRDAAWTELAWALLDLAIAHVHERDDIGDAATLIRLLLARMEEIERRGKPGRGDGRRWRQDIPGIITRIARRRDPGHLMGLVDGLVRCGGYAEYRGALEDAVLAAYHAADLVVLPQVRGYEHLPVVLELMCKPLSSPVRLPPGEIPVIAGALRKAGAADDHLAVLMAWTGNRRDLDFRDIAAELRAAGLEDEAEAVISGHARRVRGRRMRPPRFFSR